ncbi:hypothetical protein [Staphylococcus simulans]|uniref:hypothetical protein n=1 Tax=Staphylococcus simulans TaxID=1286 RepID=UPI00399B4E4A
MYEIKKIGKFDIEYDGETFPQYLFVNTYDKRVYQTVNKYDTAPVPTNMVLENIPDYFEDKAVLLEEIKYPNAPEDGSVILIDLVLLIPSLGKKIIAKFENKKVYENERMKSIYYNFNMKFEVQ